MTQSTKPSHSPRIHAYAASFGDDLAREAIAASTEEGDLVLDPFVGAGTTVLQSLLLNRHAIGIDVDPIATRISRVITGRFDISYLSDAVSSAADRLTEYETRLVANPSLYEDLVPGSAFDIGGQTFSVPNEEAIRFWFDPSHMAILAILKSLASGEPDPLVKEFFEVVLSSTIIRKWPNTLSYAMDIDHSRPHRPQLLNAQSTDKQFSLVRRILRRALGIVLRVQGELQCTDTEATIYETDADLKLPQLKPDSVDFVFTSPPYLNAIDYPRAHKFSQWWLAPQQPPLGRGRYLGLRRKQVAEESQISPLSSVAKVLVEDFEDSDRYQDMLRYVSDLSSIVQGLHRVVKPDASIVFVVADNVLQGKVFPVSGIVSELFSASGMKGVTSQRREIKSTRRRYPFGINGFKSTMRDEYLVTGQK
ncbi:MAG: DNA methyltransferase [Chloroflexi bacterium]|nr:DNA methyltransferase [Chloroflexota bacterium]MCY3588228.1 DNA methyltransferase [Chloroflexota bacterium]MCY3687067.1 DNA methyltransferase [Chloroflexota bacterium]MDE2708628.1 DNA methyltransferase [Chloroflexota bacterium]